MLQQQLLRMTLWNPIEDYAHFRVWINVKTTLIGTRTLLTCYPSPKFTQDFLRSLMMSQVLLLVSKHRFLRSIPEYGWIPARTTYIRIGCFTWKWLDVPHWNLRIFIYFRGGWRLDYQHMQFEYSVVFVQLIQAWYGMNGWRLLD